MPVRRASGSRFATGPSRRSRSGDFPTHSARATSASALELDGPLAPEPTGPRATNRRRQNEFVPWVAQLVDFYEEPDVLLGPFSENLLVHTDTVRPNSEVVAHSGLAPANVKRQFHDAGRFHQVLRIDVDGHGNGSGVRSKDGATRTGCATSLRTEPDPTSPFSAADHPNSIPTMESPDVPLRPGPSLVGSSIAS